jgi:hypothetical protein
MKAYVATAKQIDQAFESWIDAGGESEHQRRKFVHAIYQYFMDTEQARLYHTVTGLGWFAIPSTTGLSVLTAGHKVK